jgi:hypothetical protein
VGKKLILLDACSILTVYNGVGDIDGLAVTAATAKNTIAALDTAISIFVLFTLSPPFRVFVLCKRI